MVRILLYVPKVFILFIPASRHAVFLWDNGYCSNIGAPVNWRICSALYRRAFYFDALGNRMHDVYYHRRVIIGLINASEFIVACWLLSRAFLLAVEVKILLPESVFVRISFSFPCSFNLHFGRGFNFCMSAYMYILTSPHERARY
jgi:hypothetical protein